MAKRTGIPTIQKRAYRLCTIITKFSPVIKVLYPDNTTLQAALTAALSACAVLQDEVAAVREIGD